MVNEYDKITNKNVIPLKDCFFSYVEDKESQVLSPVSDYYFKIEDLSINLLISLKWVSYGYFFFKSISDTIIEEEFSKFCSEILSLDNLQPNEPLKFYKIIIDDCLINDIASFVTIVNVEYGNDLFAANSKIKLKLKLSLKDYLLLQNTHYPTLYFL